MKISDNTMKILNNFAKINQGIVVEGGTVIKTMSPTRNIIAQANIAENFPKFAISNLPEFLSAINIFNDPELEFEEGICTFGENNTYVKYRCADPSIIIAPKREIKEPDFEIKFNVTAEMFADVLKGASVLKLPDIVVTKTGDRVQFGAKDTNQPGKSTFMVNIDLEQPLDVDFEMVIRTDTFAKMIPQTYNVAISSKRLSKWVSTDNNLLYYISLEVQSKFG